MEWKNHRFNKNELQSKLLYDCCAIVKGESTFAILISLSLSPKHFYLSNEIK
jgi:hypothetical protein